MCLWKLNLIVVAMLMGLGLIPQAASAQPNILWIIADDYSPDYSANGTLGVNTPNIDALIATGANYTNAFATAPACSPSRSALITGMYQTSIGAMHHRTITKSPLPAGVNPITTYFKNAGYFTANGNSSLSGNGKTDYNFQFSFSNLFDGNDWRDAPADTPWFTQVQIFNPHRNFIDENTSCCRHNQLELPAYYPDNRLVRSDYADYLADVENLDTKVGTVLARLEADGLADNTIVFFFGDHGRPQLRDKQWLYDGGLRTPLVVRDPTGAFAGAGVEDNNMVSLIDVAAASLAVAGITVPAHMQGVNFFDPSFTGRDAIFAARDRQGGVVDRVRSIQVGDMKLIRHFYPGTPFMLDEMESNTYKYNQYPEHVLMKVFHEYGLLNEDQAKLLADSRPEYELYDLSTDPDEFDNLADDPAYAATLASLQAQLNQWITETGDMGGNFDPDAASQQANNLNNAKASALASHGLPADTTDLAYTIWWANRLGLNIQDGDFDVSKAFDLNDIYMIDVELAKAAGERDDVFDIAGSAGVDQADKAHLVETLIGTRGGDANLDKTVSLLDLNTLGANFGQPGRWSEGDANGDGMVTLLDLNTLGLNFGFDNSAPAAPEPTSLALLGVMSLVLVRRSEQLR